MKLSDICIQRPVFATVLSFVVLLLGLVAYDRLSVREYPNIDPPVVNVETVYPGASAQIMESQITQVLEDSLSGIEGIDYITSVSRQQQSQITLRFKLDRDPSDAAADVRDRVARVRGQLPDEIDEPIIEKVEADAQPIIYLAFSSDRHSPLELSDYADRYVKDQLQILTGVSQVMIFGERRYSMRIALDPTRVAGYGLTLQEIEAALAAQNVEIPAGTIESAEREFTVLSETDLARPEQFNNIVLAERMGHQVLLSDVGQAFIGAESEDSAARFNGQPAVAMGVVKQATANPLDVSAAVRERIPLIVDNLPEGMKVDIAYDSSIFIQASIDNVYSTIIEAVVLVVAVIFLFLRSFRATLVPLVTIPVSLIGAFFIMYMLGFTINTLTLLSLVLAIGLVVDDAIVMLENIFRHIEAGMSPMRAAFKGSREIAFAVIAMTITLAAVYLPIAFQTGTTGRLFTEFALTLAGAVLISGFIALTLTPMMCGLLLKHQTSHGLFYRVIEGALNALTRGYRATLRGALKVRPLILLIGLGVASGSFFLLKALPEELAPYEDQGFLIGFLIGPEGATLDYTERYARGLEGIYAGIPETETYFVVAGFPLKSQGISFVKLQTWDERSRSAAAIAESVGPAMFGGLPGVLAFPIPPAPLGQAIGEKPVQFVVQSSMPYQELGELVDRIVAKARENPGLQNIETDLKLNRPQLSVSVDRAKAADLGIGVDVIGRTLETALGGRQITRFKLDGDQYDVIVRLDDRYRATPSDLTNIYVRSASGEMVQLSNLVTVTETVAPQALNHFNQLRAVTLDANLAPGYALGEALAYLNDIARDELGGRATTDLSGQSREFRDSASSLVVTFVLALGFIFLVLAAQFESWRDPFIIMLTVPLSITGGLLALYLSGGTFNIYSQVGVVTLIGLITKHGILIVEFSNQIRREGLSRSDAVVEAAVQRLRPILMTTGAMVLGTVPLALATGAGAESRQDIGWVIVGGLLVGTFFTLFVIPTVYTYISRRDMKPIIDAPSDADLAREGAQGHVQH
ncbi:acriflavin resistance protein [Tistrella bauzanensis]|uniref:Acriflavin resistance protein n=1 Tax=Tistrella bauzanensis TaxID=657419 RepID=A0ABQ1IDZ7_9PROT|nr:efflux RND transporter permease subunit [Tistrella bauzanensis]GGB36108.1 acriflavin resistance protein [Tistrella bauzanensis]